MIPVVIIAGGLATRMHPITEKIPKSLLGVRGKPFIFHQLSLLEKNHVNEVVLCLGHLGKMVEDYLTSEHFSLNINFSYDGEKLLGTGGAVRKATQNMETPFFVLYGDSYLDIEYRGIADAYMNCGKPGLMTVYHNDGQWDTSNVVYTNGKINCYSKKKRTPEMRHIDYGLGVLAPEVFQNHESDTTFDLAEIYERLSENGDLFGYEVHKRFYEIGSSAGLVNLEDYLSSQEGIYEQSGFSG